MSRILGVDYGDKRIGLALTDPSRTFASALSVIDNNDQSIKKLKNIISEYEVGHIVLGMPINLKGIDTPATTKARAFGKKMETELQMSIELWDERYTTRDAQDTLIEGGVSRKKRKKVIDKVAAVFILRSYMESPHG